jgi:hypothetical protein
MKNTAKTTENGHWMTAFDLNGDPRRIFVPAKTPVYQASNSRLYTIVRESSLDYYVWVLFLDDPNEEKLIMHTSDAKQINA